MTLPHESIVLHDHVAAGDVASIAEQERLGLVDDITRGHFILATRTWFGQDGTQLVYIEDHTADVRHLRISGPQRWAMATRVRARLPNFDALELLEEASSIEAPHRCVRVLSRLALYRPEAFDARYLAAWKRMLEHPSKAVRRAAIRTAHGCPWPQMHSLLEQRLATGDELAPSLVQLLRTFD